MGNIRINLPDNLYRNLKRRAIDEGTPMRDLLVKALQKYIEQNPSTATNNYIGQVAEKARSKLTRRHSQRKPNGI